MSIDAESLIAHLANALVPADRAAFRHENALVVSPQCWGPDSIYRIIVPLWRSFFHPPTFRTTAWDQGRESSKLVAEPPLPAARDRRRVRIVHGEIDDHDARLHGGG
jgi:hypothetical protein